MMVLALAGTASAQTPPKEFMAAPVTIEDQRSFFIGGVTRVTDLAAVPFAPPGQPVLAAVPQQITIGQMYVQFQIPQRRSGPGSPVIMVHGSTHTGAALEPRTVAKAGSLLRPQGRIDVCCRSSLRQVPCCVWWGLPPPKALL